MRTRHLPHRHGPHTQLSSTFRTGIAGRLSESSRQLDLRLLPRLRIYLAFRRWRGRPEYLQDDAKVRPRETMADLCGGQTYWEDVSHPFRWIYPSYGANARNEVKAEPIQGDRRAKASSSSPAMVEGGMGAFRSDLHCSESASINFHSDNHVCNSGLLQVDNTLQPFLHSSLTFSSRCALADCYLLMTCRESYRVEYR